MFLFWSRNQSTRIHHRLIPRWGRLIDYQLFFWNRFQFQHPSGIPVVIKRITASATCGWRGSTLTCIYLYTPAPIPHPHSAWKLTFQFILTVKKEMNMTQCTRLVNTFQLNIPSMSQVPCHLSSPISLKYTDTLITNPIIPICVIALSY